MADIQRIGWHEVKDGMVVVDKIGDVWHRRGHRVYMIYDGTWWEPSGSLHDKGLSGNVCSPDLLLVGIMGESSPNLRRLGALLLSPRPPRRGGPRRDDDGWHSLINTLTANAAPEARS